MNIQSGRTLTVNGVTADFGNETLRDKREGSVDLRPQAFAVLRHLRGDCRSPCHQRRLIEAVWPGIAVTDDSLFQCIHEIRRAFHDDEPPVLKTVPKRGYRLLLSANGLAGGPHTQVTGGRDSAPGRFGAEGV